MAAVAGKGSALGWIVPLVVLTGLAGGGGFLVARQIVAAVKPAAAKPDAAAPEKPAPSTDAVREMAPVVTNLASPDGAFVRLQTALVYDKTVAPAIDILAAKISDDMLAFVKTLTVAQLQGANGLQHLREDLNERAMLRSDGHVKELIIESLVVQ